MSALNNWIATFSNYLWGAPALIVLVGTGLLLTVRLNFIQIRGFREAVAITFGKYLKADHSGENHPFKALCASLSATVGTGNIAGVATAVTLGGPGALFWMWMTAVLGMATKYATSTLAVRYRHLLPDGTMAGGPMYVLRDALNFRTLAVGYAFFTLIASFGIGNTVQSNSIVSALGFVWPSLHQYAVFIGLLLAIGVAAVIIGGVQRIATVAALIVPGMVVLYCGTALLVIGTHLTQVPAALGQIITMAFSGSSVLGGGIGAAIRFGVARGVFSNEAGLGTAGIMHASARTDHPVRQGLVAMLGPFIDTLIVCTMTGLVIVLSGVWHPGHDQGNQGAALTAFAFEQGLPAILAPVGPLVVSIGLVFFAFSTMISWSYYGNRSVLFLWGKQAILPYKIIFVLMIIAGAVFPLELLWNIADIMNILMALPNLIAICWLSAPLRQLTLLSRHIIQGQ